MVRWRGTRGRWFVVGALLSASLESPAGRADIGPPCRLVFALHSGRNSGPRPGSSATYNILTGRGSEDGGDDEDDDGEGDGDLTVADDRDMARRRSDAVITTENVPGKSAHERGVDAMLSKVGDLEDDVAILGNSLSRKESGDAFASHSLAEDQAKRQQMRDAKLASAADFETDVEGQEKAAQMTGRQLGKQKAANEAEKLQGMQQNAQLKAQINSGRGVLTQGDQAFNQELQREGEAINEENADDELAERGFDAASKSALADHKLDTDFANVQRGATAAESEFEDFLSQLDTTDESHMRHLDLKLQEMKDKCPPGTEPRGLADYLERIDSMRVRNDRQRQVEKGREGRGEGDGEGSGDGEGRGEGKGEAEPCPIAVADYPCPCVMETFEHSVPSLPPEREAGKKGAMAGASRGEEKEAKEGEGGEEGEEVSDLNEGELGKGEVDPGKVAVKESLTSVTSPPARVTESLKAVDLGPPKPQHQPPEKGPVSATPSREEYEGADCEEVLADLEQMHGSLRNLNRHDFEAAQHKIKAGQKLLQRSTG